MGNISVKKNPATFLPQSALHLKCFKMAIHEIFSLCFFFSFLSGYYFTGDGARRDADGHYHITGRVDDVINVKGVRLGTAEVEDVMVWLHS